MNNDFNLLLLYLSRALWDKVKHAKRQEALKEFYKRVQLDTSAKHEAWDSAAEESEQNFFL